MSWTTTIITYGSAYTFLSLCIALVVGRLFRTMQPVLELETPAAAEASPRRGTSDQNAQPEALVRALLT